VIAYFDTSSLVKAYVEEEGSAAVRQLFASVESAGSSSVLLVELRGALARMLATSRLDDGTYAEARLKFDSDWKKMAKLPVTSPLLDLAVQVAERHLLRALDAIHLASALTLNRGEEVVLSSWDQLLLDAAVAEGIRVIPVQ